MATRFYWGQVVTAPTPAFSATWSAPGSTPTRLLMRTVKRKAASTTPLIATASETTAAILNKQHVQLISMPLAAQTITGTVKGYALFSESDTAQDCRVQCEIRIISQAGVVRGTLLAANTDALSSEFIATPTNRRIPLLAATNTLTSVSAQEGDYLVVEIGHRTHVASGTSYTATVRWSDNPGSTDLPEDETDTDTTKAPWIEFSQTLLVNDTFDSFVPAAATPLSSAEHVNVVIPDFAPKDNSRDTLAEFNTQFLNLEIVNRVALQSVDTNDPTFVELPTVGAPSAAGFEDIGLPNKQADSGAEHVNALIPDFARRDVYRDTLAEFNTGPLNFSLVEPASDTSSVVLATVTTRYINRVYDSVAVKFVRWITATPDTIGAGYPGPGVFGVTTSDYVIESSVVI